MLVRCGRCRTELEVAGAGEFACPRCGTRNVVRGAPAVDPYDLGGLAAPPPPPRPESPPPGVLWVQCPSCAYRFALGEVTAVSCPACSQALELIDGSVRAAG